jgi:hypothetical protein
MRGFEGAQALLEAEEAVDDALRRAAFFYGLTLTIGGILFDAVCFYATRNGGLHQSSAPASFIAASLRRFFLGPILYAVVAVQALGTVRPEVPKLLNWDNAPPHHPHRVSDTARAVNVTLSFLPFRSPELMSLEDLWRGLKTTVAANRCYPSLQELTQRALVWLNGMSTTDRLRRCGFDTSKFDWLPT